MSSRTKGGNDEQGSRTKDGRGERRGSRHGRPDRRPALALGRAHQHGDHARENGGQEKRIDDNHHPGPAVHGGAQDGELAGERAEGRRTQDGEHARHPERAGHRQGAQGPAHI